MLNFSFSYLLLPPPFILTCFFPQLFIFLFFPSNLSWSVLLSSFHYFRSLSKLLIIVGHFRPLWIYTTAANWESPT
ncbi:hypothetical protein BDV25DRAFT_3942 [Aspergillus avenaceus]|uniref:Uncharacterized protein n=1 Tax=Aspergillus avenaceus TaxID=36643 RepID=A0A5N6TSH7_ASPAV|nr:hypothetical protein BDV25DRAFT_3942 [Aspergillus avenaceus]